MIAVLDQAVAAVEKSGVFSEIGKSGHGSTAGAAEAKIETIAKGYMGERFFFGLCTAEESLGRQPRTYK